MKTKHRRLNNEFDRGIGEMETKVEEKMKRKKNDLLTQQNQRMKKKKK